MDDRSWGLSLDTGDGFGTGGEGGASWTGEQVRTGERTPPVVRVRSGKRVLLSQTGRSEGRSQGHLRRGIGTRPPTLVETKD